MGINYRASNKGTKYSYSRVNVFDSCGWKYYLTYEAGHYIYQDSLAADFGTLVHHIEESIGLSLKAGEKPNYDKLKDEFEHINIPKKDKYDTEGGIYGIEILKKKYPKEFFEANQNGQSYFTKSLDYKSTGIYRLENRLSKAPNLKVWACEQYFDVTFLNRRFGGFIDRIIFDEDTGDYYVEDIKTKDHPFKDEELVTPLQFVIYVQALSDMLNIDPKKIHCVYDLPICDWRQDAGTKGFLKRGLTKLEKIFNQIDNKEFVPNPTPLCWWCPFNHGNPDAPAEGKNLCPYYSLWRPDNRVREVANLWEGMERHAIIVKRLDNNEVDSIIDFDF